VFSDVDDSSGEPWAAEPWPALDPAELEPDAQADPLVPQDAAVATDGTVGADGASEADSDEQGLPGEDVASSLEGWLSATEAADVLGVEPAEVRRRCREGELDAAKDGGGAWRINPAALTTS
jgi:excisionase family DNA binding protein